MKKKSEMLFLTSIIMCIYHVCNSPDVTLSCIPFHEFVELETQENMVSCNDHQVGALFHLGDAVLLE